MKAMRNSKDALCATFQRRHVDPELARVYAMTAFRKNTLSLNCLLANALVDVYLYHTNGGPSFLRIQGNKSIALRILDSRYSFLWSRGPSSMKYYVHGREFMKYSVEKTDF